MKNSAVYVFIKDHNPTLDGRLLKKLFSVQALQASHCIHWVITLCKYIVAATQHVLTLKIKSAFDYLSIF